MKKWLQKWLGINPSLEQERYIATQAQLAQLTRGLDELTEASTKLAETSTKLAESVGNIATQLSDHATRLANAERDIRDCFTITEAQTKDIVTLKLGLDSQGKPTKATAKASAKAK